jgi:hypothetical protein
MGVPIPDFGIAETAPSAPSPWNASQSTNSGYRFYYVCPGCSGATDSSNASGYPGRARQTIPSPLTGPSVVMLDGQIDSNMSFTGTGSPSAPVFVTSFNPSSPAHLTVTLAPSGSYIIVDGLWFGPRDTSDPEFGVYVGEGSSHIAIRNSEFAGNLNRAGGIALGTWGYTGTNSVSYVVVDHNSIHDIGDVSAVSDQDAHCIVVNGSDDHIWVTYNTLQYCSGDAIQIEAQTGRNQYIHHVYYGKNQAHHNRQTGGWVKHATDVIFSQNVAHDFRQNSGGPGSCYGFQYGPEMVWFLFNEGYACNIGFDLAGNDPVNGQYSFIIGNIIHDTNSQLPTDVYNAGAMVIRGGTAVYVLSNTMYNVDAGVNVPPGSTAFYYYNNIVANRSNASAYDLYLEGNISVSIQNNIFSAAGPRFEQNGIIQTSVADFQASTGTCQGCMSADPLFVNAPGGDFRLAPGSPGIDAGSSAVSTVYDTFKSRYGIDISKDFAGAPRPQGAGWDIGAFER